MEHEGDDLTNLCTWSNLQRIGKENGRFRNQTKIRDHPDYRITKIG